MLVDTTERSEHWIAARQVRGTAVYNIALEELGTVHDLLISRTTSRVTHAVVKFGGYFHMRRHYCPLPWESFSYSKELRGYIVDIDRDMLTLGSSSYPERHLPQPLSSHEPLSSQE